MAVFAGGSGGETETKEGNLNSVDAYDSELVKHIPDTLLSVNGYWPAGACVGNYMLFGGASINSYSNHVVDAYLIE